MKSWIFWERALTVLQTFAIIAGVILIFFRLEDNNSSGKKRFSGYNYKNLMIILISPSI